MHRPYKQTVTVVDGPSVPVHGGNEPTPPARTRPHTAIHPSEPERIEILRKQGASTEEIEREIFGHDDQGRQEGRNGHTEGAGL
ncbi:hypothetical protein [Sinomonas soli]